MTELTLAVEGRAAERAPPPALSGEEKGRSPRTCLPGTALPLSADSLVAAILGAQHGEGGVTFRHQTTVGLCSQLKPCELGLLAARSLAVRYKTQIMKSAQQTGLSEGI